MAGDPRPAERKAARRHRRTSRTHPQSAMANGAWRHRQGAGHEPAMKPTARRRVLGGLLGLGATGLGDAGLAAPGTGTARGPRVGVVGGGIVGASIAMHLAQA